MAMTELDVVRQSKNALSQWGEQWKKHSKYHSDYEMKPISEFQNYGIGKALVLCATGHSLETNMETLKKHRENVDIMVCDKGLGMLLDNGIKPDFCIICDANVSFEKYCEPWANQVEETILFMNVCGNPDWTTRGSWKDRYFFVNEDAIQTEQIFGPLSKCPNYIPAGTNVSNAMLILACQSRNDARLNFFGYDKIILIGFDYCWHPDGSYYAYSKSGEGKRHYMKHVGLIDTKGDYVFTSNNLLFSAQWAARYVGGFGLPVVNCSDHSILGSCHQGSLEEHITYEFRKGDVSIVRDKTKKLSQLNKEMLNIKEDLKKIGNAHWAEYEKSL